MSRRPRTREERVVSTASDPAARAASTLERSCLVSRPRARKLRRLRTCSWAAVEGPASFESLRER